VNTVSRHATNPSPAPRHGTAESAAAMIEQLIDRLFLRALQFTLGGVLLGIAFLPLCERGSALEMATAAIRPAAARRATPRRAARRIRQHAGGSLYTRFSRAAGDGRRHPARGAIGVTEGRARDGATIVPWHVPARRLASQS